MNGVQKKTIQIQKNRLEALDAKGKITEYSLWCNARTEKSHNKCRMDRLNVRMSTDGKTAV